MVRTILKLLTVEINVDDSKTYFKDDFIFHATTITFIKDF